MFSPIGLRILSTFYTGVKINIPSEKKLLTPQGVILRLNVIYVFEVHGFICFLCINDLILVYVLRLARPTCTKIQVDSISSVPFLEDVSRKQVTKPDKLVFQLTQS